MDLSASLRHIEYDPKYLGFNFFNRFDYGLKNYGESQFQDLLGLISKIYPIKFGLVYKIDHEGNFHKLRSEFKNDEQQLNNIEVWNQFQSVVTSSFPRKLTFNAVKYLATEGDLYHNLSGDQTFVAYPLKCDRKIYGILVLGGDNFENPVSLNGIDPKTLKNILDIFGMGLHRISKGRDYIDSSEQTLNKLVFGLSAHDTYTSIHSNKTAVLSEKIAKLMDCTDHEIQLLRWGSVFHDIGKIVIPKKILSKPARLDETEWAVMKLHPEIGSLIVGLTTGLSVVSEIILTHHEHFDGNGYPKYLHSIQIPLVSRILSVVDAFGAMTENRAYQKAKPTGAALQELMKYAGSYFDPAVVDKFFRILTTRDLIIENTV